VHGFEFVEVKLPVDGIEIQGLASHHAQGAGGPSQLLYQLQVDMVACWLIGWGQGCEHFKSEGLQAIPGKNGGSFAIDNMAGGNAAPQVVIIHRGQIVVDQ